MDSVEKMKNKANSKPNKANLFPPTRGRGLNMGANRKLARFFQENRKTYLDLSADMY